MRNVSYVLSLLLITSHLSLSQVVTADGFEQNELKAIYHAPDSVSMKIYFDSLKQVFADELLTGYAVSILHEQVAFKNIEFSINNKPFSNTTTDSIGRFYMVSESEITQLRIKFTDPEYHVFDSTYSIDRTKRIIAVPLSPKYKIMLRGRVFAGNIPVDGVKVKIKHKALTFNLSTLNCYTDDENYWNCLYLGMFKQAVHFEDPADSIKIEIINPGFKNKTIALVAGEYDGAVMPIKLKYENKLLRFPKHNATIKFGYTFSKTWAVGLQYMYQLQLGGFNRLGLGVEGSMLTNSVTTTHTTFDNLPEAKAETFYTIGMIGPLVNVAITDPTNRYLNLHAGVVASILVPKAEISIQPYITGKFYLDINKALIWEVRYLEYSIDQYEYTFNQYGNSSKTKVNQNYSKVLFSLGLLVSFNINDE